MTGKCTRESTWRYPPVGSRADQVRRTCQRGRAKVARVTAGVGGVIDDAGRLLFGAGPNECFAKLLPKTQRSQSIPRKEENFSAPMLMMVTGFGFEEKNITVADIFNVIKKRETANPGLESILQDTFTVVSNEFRFAMRKIITGTLGDGGRIRHNMKVAYLLAVMGLSPKAVMAGMCLGVSPDRVRVKLETAGSEVAAILTGTASLEKFYYDPGMEADKNSNAEKSKVLLARIREAPSLASHVVRAVDQLVTLQTSFKENRRKPVLAKQRAYAKLSQTAGEAYYLGADILEKMGYGNIAAQLLDVAAEHLNPQRQADLRSQVMERAGLDQEQACALVAKLRRVCSAAIEGRGFMVRIKDGVKTLERIDDKFHRAELKVREQAAENLSVKEINDKIWQLGGRDYLRMRFICEKEEEIDAIFLIVKDKLKQVGFRLDRDIVVHKENGYVSRHLTFWRDGVGLSIQLRTERQDHLAEWGSASHWMYKRKAGSFMGGLAAKEADELAVSFGTLGKTQDETRQLRWETLVRLAGRYVFVYAVTGRGRPGKAKGNRLKYLTEKGWHRAQIVRCYMGDDGTAVIRLLPSALDVGVALAGTDFDNIPAVVNVESEGGVVNGGIVFVREGSKVSFTALDAALCNSPLSLAILQAEWALAQVQSNTRVYFPFPANVNQVMEGKRLFQLYLDKARSLKLSASPSSNFLRIRSSVTLMDLFSAVNNSGFRSLEVLHALFYMFSREERLREVVWQKFNYSLKQCVTGVAIANERQLSSGRKTVNVFFLTPDRPGVNMALLSLLNKTPGVQVLGATNATHDFTQIDATQAVTGFALLIDRELVLADLIEQNIKYIYRDLPEIPDRYLGKRYRIAVRVGGNYKDTLFAIFAALAKRRLNISNMIVPVKTSEPGTSTLLLEIQFPRGKGRSRSLVDLQQALKEIREVKRVGVLDPKKHQSLHAQLDNKTISAMYGN